MPGSRQGRRAAKEGHRSRLEGLLAAVRGIHLAGAEPGSHPAGAEEGIHPVAGEVRHNRLAVPEGAGPT
jgi:hypothetical protein